MLTYVKYGKTYNFITAKKHQNFLSPEVLVIFTLHQQKILYKFRHFS